MFLWFFQVADKAIFIPRALETGFHRSSFDGRCVLNGEWFSKRKPFIFFAKKRYIPLWLECTSLSYLVLVGRDILRNILNPTIQNTTQVIDGSCIHWLVFPQLIDRSTGNAVFCDQGVGCFLRIFQCFPKWTVVNHFRTSY